jgi:hypothetical protein
MGRTGLGGTGLGVLAIGALGEILALLGVVLGAGGGWLLILGGSAFIVQAHRPNRIQGCGAIRRTRTRAPLGSRSAASLAHTVPGHTWR